MSAGFQQRARRSHEATPSSLVIHNVVVAGHRTSVRLEPIMWEALHDIAQRRGISLHDLVTEIDRDRATSSLTAGIRVYIVDFYREAAVRAAQPQTHQASALLGKRQVESL